MEHVRCISVCRWVHVRVCVQSSRSFSASRLAYCWSSHSEARCRRAASACSAAIWGGQARQGREEHGDYPCSCFARLGQATGGAWLLQTSQPGSLPQPPLPPRGLHLPDPSKACAEPTCAAGDELNLRTNSASSSSRVSCGRQAGRLTGSSCEAWQAGSFKAQLQTDSCPAHNDPAALAGGQCPAKLPNTTRLGSTTSALHSHRCTLHPRTSTACRLAYPAVAAAVL